MPEDQIDDDIWQSDFKSARRDLSRSHYTLLGRALGQHSLVTNLDDEKALGSDFAAMRRAKARAMRLAREAGLPEAAAEEAARVVEEAVRALGWPGGHAREYAAAAAAIAAMRLGLPITHATWESIAAAALGLPEDSSRWSEEEREEARRFLATVRRVVAKLVLRAGIRAGRRADPLEAIPDPELRHHAVRLYNELKEAGAPSGVGTRALALYLASLAANRPLHPPELRELAARYLGTRMAGAGRRQRTSRLAMLEALSRVALRVVVAPGQGWALSNNYPRGTAGEPVALLRVRCAACGYEWELVARAPATGSFAVGAVAAALNGLACPACHAKLGRVVELHAEPRLPSDNTSRPTSPLGGPGGVGGGPHAGREGRRA